MMVHLLCMTDMYEKLTNKRMPSGCSFAEPTMVADRDLRCSSTIVVCSRLISFPIATVVRTDGFSEKPPDGSRTHSID